MLRVPYNTLFTFLFCLYALLIPFEHILEIFWGIDTVLKPYRIIALIIIGTYGVKLAHTKKLEISFDIKIDVFIYSVFIYGLFITAVQLFWSPFQVRYFYNDSFQLFLYLSTFFILKNTSFSFLQFKKIIWSLIIGISLNAAYIFYLFYASIAWQRQEGFMDNPNYVSISLVLAFSFVFSQSSYAQKRTNQLLLLLLSGFLILMIIVSGSRTGFVIFGVLLIVLFWFASLFRKIIILGLLVGLSVLYIGTGQNNASIDIPLITFKRFNKLDSSEDTRFPLWRGGYKAVLASNFAGLGIGQFKTRFREFYLLETEKTIYENVNRGAALSAHSDFMAITITYGLFGLLAYLIFLFKSTKEILSNLYTSNTEAFYFHAQFRLMVLVTLIIFGITSENFTSALFWLALAISTKNTFTNNIP